MSNPPSHPDAPATGERTFALEAGLSASLTVGLAVVLVVEGAILHVWIASRSQRWAWALTAINAATLLWLWRDFRTVSRSAVTVRDDDVEVIVGTRMRCLVPLAAIASAEAATWRSVPDRARDYLDVSKPGEPNVTLVLREPVTAELPLGLRKRVTRIGLRVANPARLLAAIASARSRR